MSFHFCVCIFQAALFLFTAVSEFSMLWNDLSHLLYFPLQPLITELTDVSQLQLREDLGMIPALSEGFHSSEISTMQNISKN